MKTVSEDGIKIIKFFEGLRLDAYKCPAGVWTIGWGTTVIDGKPVRQGMKITREQAERYLREDVARFVREARKYTPNLDDLPQPAFDAVAGSLLYNLGVQQFVTGKKIPIEQTKLRSTVWRGVVARDPKKIAAGLVMFNKVNGRVSKGLVNRRNMELELLEKAVWSAPLPPPPDIPAPEPSAPTASPAPSRGRYAVAGGLLALIVTIILWILNGGSP